MDDNCYQKQIFVFLNQNPEVLHHKITNWILQPLEFTVMQHFALQCYSNAVQYSRIRMITPPCGCYIWIFLSFDKNLIWTLEEISHQKIVFLIVLMDE